MTWRGKKRQSLISKSHKRSQHQSRTLSRCVRVRVCVLLCVCMCACAALSKGARARACVFGMAFRVAASLFFILPINRKRLCASYVLLSSVAATTAGHFLLSSKGRTTSLQTSRANRMKNPCEMFVCFEFDGFCRCLWDSIFPTFGSAPGVGAARVPRKVHSQNLAN